MNTGRKKENLQNIIMRKTTRKKIARKAVGRVTLFIEEILYRYTNGLI